MVFILGSVWAFAYGMEMAAGELALKIRWMQVYWTAAAFGPLLFLMIVLEHLKLTHLLTRWRLALLLLPSLILLVLIWTIPNQSLILYGFVVERVGSLDILQKKYGILHTPIFLVLQGISLVSYYFLLRSFSGASQIQRRQSIAILLALLVPFVANIPFILDINPIKGFDFTPHALVLTSGLFAFAIFHYRWLDILPLAHTTLAEVIPVGVVVLDVANRIMDINPSARQILQIPASVVGRDVREVFADFGDIFRPQTEMEPFKKEVSVKLHGKQSGYFEIHVKPLTDHIGRVNGNMVMFHDITERKREELRLLQLTMAVEQGPDSVVITDLDGVIEYVNPQFTKLTGYTYEDAVGKNASLVQSGRTPDSVYQDMWQTIKAGGTWRGEVLNRKKHGAFFWDMAVIAPVKDEAGNIINFIAIQKDITPQKEAEEALRRSESELREANLQLADQLEKVNRLQAELRYQAIRDPLTGLYNRRYLIENLEREFLRAARNLQPLSILLMDIDHFKVLNDTCGHLAGDACLKAVAGFLNQHIRKSDIASRYGGEEFLLVLPQTSLDVAAQRAEQLRQMLAETAIPYRGQQLRLTVSLGVSAYPVHFSECAEELINHADQALYESKRTGRNRVTVWKQELGS